mmetsp:Transcript_31385/g.54460  ORF Transcript_31385/g.54460 Transcript_31385/m.54460 type:complete len:83 (-) Transcript_31385:490-738(-)
MMWSPIKVVQLTLELCVFSLVGSRDLLLELKLLSRISDVNTARLKLELIDANGKSLEKPLTHTPQLVPSLADYPDKTAVPCF